MSSLRRWIFVVAVVGAGSGSLCSAAAQAQVVPPEASERVLPEPPENRFGFPMEGWVVLRYSVLADGRTDNVRVVDRMPPQLVDREVVAAAEDWTFRPATDAGKPIEWHSSESVVVFDLPDVPAEPSPFFLRAYREVQELLDAGEPDKALKRNERMRSMETSRLIEIGVGEMQNAMINMRLGDLHSAYAAIVRATDPRVPALVDADLGAALQYRNVIELQLGDVAGVLDTFARRSALGPIPDDDPVAGRIGAIETGLGGEAAIAIKGKVGDEPWRHPMARRTFSLADVDGDLKSISVECDRRSVELEYAPDAEWKLPESWGACSVAIEGRRDTEFVFYEFR